MSTAAPSMSDRDGKRRAFTRVRVSDAGADVIAATAWKACGQAMAVRHDAASIPFHPEALKDGDGKAIMLDVAGWEHESSGETSGRIEGDMGRSTTRPVCKDRGLEVLHKRITRDELYIADEVFFTGTAAEVAPIREVDRLQIGEGRRGPLTEKIQNAFFDIVNGRNSKYAHWLTRV